MSYRELEVSYQPFSTDIAQGAQPLQRLIRRKFGRGLSPGGYSGLHDTDQLLNSVWKLFCEVVQFTRISLKIIKLVRMSES